ncbi:MAG: HAMP domain-containing sensor histidine kinase [Clostridia bacterium]|nr:HAMP domain-containing sensor histidine kinase [Clostridia bacterium]
MKRFRLRTKIVVAFTLASILMSTVFFGLIHLVTDRVLDTRRKENLSLAVSQLISQVELWNDGLIFEDETPVANELCWFIMEGNGSELASHGRDIALFDAIPFRPETYTAHRIGDETWFVLDSEVFVVENEDVVVRVATTDSEDAAVLATLRLIFVCFLPVMALGATVTGLLLARGVLRPVREISACAEEIAKGDLSKRIPPAAAKDELGELTDTLNRMIGAVESSFLREKRFTDDASHELRTPIAVIRAYSEELLTHDELTDEQRASVKTVLGEALRMQHMTEQMLTLSRAQNGKLTLHPEAFDLAGAAEGVLSALEDKVTEKRLDCQTEFSGDTQIVADQTMISRLLLNLTENAVKYTPDGGNIRIRIRNLGETFLIAVEDDGPGIPADDLPHVFERFYRSDKARDRSGTGLGLAIVKQIAELHHGTASVESAEGKGSVFTVRLPVRYVTAE